MLFYSRIYWLKQYYKQHRKCFYEIKKVPCNSELLRFDKLARNCQSTVYIACMLIWRKTKSEQTLVLFKKFILKI